MPSTLPKQSGTRPMLHALVIALVTLLAVPSRGSSQPNLEATLVKATGEIAGYRSQAEAAARRIKDGLKPTDDEYKAAEVLYANASAAVERLVAQLKAALRTKPQDELTEELRRSLDGAIAQTNIFLSFSQEVAYGRGGPRPTVVPHNLGKIVTAAAFGLGKALVEWWKASHEINEERKDRLAKELDALRWKAFRDL